MQKTSIIVTIWSIAVLAIILFAIIYVLVINARETALENSNELLNIIVLIVKRGLL